MRGPGALKSEKAKPIPPSSATPNPSESLVPAVFAAGFGAFLGLLLIKFGSPPIMERWITAPTNVLEFIFFTPWPIAWAYWLLVAVVVLGFFAAQWRPKPPPWIIALPLPWLAWQFLASMRTLGPELTHPTLAHFISCAACFYLGLFALSRVRRTTVFWAFLLCAFLVVLAVGWQQHFGGLEETRRYFYLYEYPKWKEVPAEYLQKMSSNRIFSTLFYPNTLAGALLLLLPVVLALVAQAQKLLTPAARGFVMGCVGLGALATLYWSGSKGGWLLMLVLGLITLFRLPFGRRFRIALALVVLLSGLAGFVYKYSGFFQRGATSVSARFDYWRAAVLTVNEQPVFGTGPGTFMIPYQRLKRPESEMTRLVHNDYLQQASDSGLPGFLAYAFFVAAGLWRGFPRSEPAASQRGNWVEFAVWLGTLGWALQGLMEFSLYIPALAWPAFTFLGLLLGKPTHNNPYASSPSTMPIPLD